MASHITSLTIVYSMICSTVYSENIPIWWRHNVEPSVWRFRAHEAILMFLCMTIYIFQYKALQGTIIQQTHIGKPLLFYRETKQAYLLELQIFM